MARRTLKELMAVEADLDHGRLDATTEEDIRRYKVEEGYAFEPSATQTVRSPAAIRQKLGMTQEAFARALRIPVGTLRNWEQGRKLPDPAARSLLNAVDRAPGPVLAALDASSQCEDGDLQGSKRRAINT